MYIHVFLWGSLKLVSDSLGQNSGYWIQRSRVLGPIWISGPILSFGSNFHGRPGTRFRTFNFNPSSKPFKTLILFLGRRNFLTYQVFFSWQAAHFYHTVVSRWYCTHKNRIVWRHNDVINNDLCLSTPLRTLFVRQSMKNRSHFFH